MLEHREGKRVPDVTFKTQRNGKWVDVTTAELFSGKTVIVFSLPGAFTPTCSSTHLPRYNELAATFKDNGVDDILCLSVNDTFVMNAWKADQEAENVTLLPDGSGAFTDGMGMLVNKDNIGFGMRSWRYSMLVRDGVVEQMFIEPEVGGDPFEVSDADTMLAYINADAKKPEFVTLFSREGCPHCARAKLALEERGMAYEEILLGRKVTSRSLRAVTGATTTPQVYIGGKRIGGADDLEAYLKG
jgi:glutathione-dependent peroxiredoxin